MDRLLPELTPSTLPQYEDCVLTSDTLTLASKSDVVVIRGVDLRQAHFVPTTAPGSTTTVYVIHLLDVNGKEYLLALGSLADQKTWTNTASGAAQALRDIRVVMGEGGSGPGGGQVDSVVAGDAIAVDATDPANPIVDVLVDGVTIGFNGSNQLEVPAGGGGYVPTTRTINTTAPLTGGGNLSANRTFAVSDFTNGARGTVPASGGGTTNFLRADQTWAAPPAGTVTNVTATSPLSSTGGATPNITASTSNGGLGAADSGKLLVFGAQGQFAASSAGAPTALDVLATGVGGAITASANTGVTVSLENVGGATTLYTESNAPANPPLHANNLHATGPIAFFHGAGGALGMELGSDGGAAWTSATGAQTTATNLPAFGTATKGVVPASGGGTSNFLRADGTFAAPAGTAGITSLTGGVTATGPGAAAATVVTNANLTGPITSVGNATSIASSVALPGSPTTTTQATGTNDTTIATTAFVYNGMALKNPSFLTYSGGSQVYAVTTLAAVNSTTFTFPSTGLYHVQYTITHDANATTTGANFGVAGTAVFDYLDIVVIYRVDSATAGRTGFAGTQFSSVGGGGIPAQSSASTTSNRVSVDVWINVTTVGDVSLLAASEVAVANGITVTAVTGFMKKESS